MSFSLHIQNISEEFLIVESNLEPDQRELWKKFPREDNLPYQGKGKHHHDRQNRSQIRRIQRILNRLDNRTGRAVIRMRAVMFRLQDWKRKNEQEERTGKDRPKTLGRKHFPNLRMILIHFGQKIVKTQKTARSPSRPTCIKYLFFL